jgi:Terminase small subunit
MPPLDNPRWERFAQELAKGQSQTGAYLAAGYRGAKSPTTAASRLLTNVKILERVRELQERGADRAEVTVGSHPRGRRGQKGGPCRPPIFRGNCRRTREGRFVGQTG